MRKMREKGSGEEGREPKRVRRAGENRKRKRQEEEEVSKSKSKRRREHAPAVPGPMSH